MRVVREFSFNERGEFVIAHTLEKISGEQRVLAIWPVTQIPPPGAVYLPLNPNSAYPNGVHVFGAVPATACFETLLEAQGKTARPTTLKITPTSG